MTRKQKHVLSMQQLLAGTTGPLTYDDYAWIVRMDDEAMTGQLDLNSYYETDNLGLDWSAWKDLYRQAVGQAMCVLDDVLDSRWEEASGYPRPTLEELGL